MMAKCEDGKISKCTKKQHLINIFIVFCDKAASTWPCGNEGKHVFLLTEFCSEFCFKAPSVCLHILTDVLTGLRKAPYNI